MSIDKELLKQIEQVVNNFGAELTVQKLTLQHLVAAMVVAIPMLAEETLETLKTDVLAALKKPLGLSN